MYYLSELNPSDGPTRGRPPPASRGALPDWWESLAAGNARGFDACGWLKLAAHFKGSIFLTFQLLLKTSPLMTLMFPQMPTMQISLGLQLLVLKTRPGWASLLGNSDALAQLRTSASRSPRTVCRKRRFFGRALLKLGAPWVLSFDLERSPDQDLLDSKLRSKIKSLIVAAIGMAPPGGSFSRAVTPSVRSARFPRGYPWLKGLMRAKVTEGNQHADWCLRLIDLSEAAGMSWWLDQPDTSWMWRLSGFRRFRAPDSQRVWRADLCYFGTPWRKRTKVACSCELAGARCFCRCRLPHIQLRGRCRASGRTLTAVAQPYPKAFAETLALDVGREVGWCDRRKPLDIPGCARCAHGRIGEAAHPGPRRARQRREGDLQSRLLQSSATLAYEAQLWEDFVGWCSSRLSDCLLVFSLCPVLAAMALRAYGNHCFGAGGTLSGFRHTIIAAQRRVLGCKPFLHLAWEMVSRWEALEPPVHRCPLPAPIVKAMAFLADAWE